MKNVFVMLMLTLLTQATLAQKDENAEPTFKKENLFTGGDVTLAFSNIFTVLGARPYFGYSVNKYLDVAASFGYSYTSQRDYYVFNDKVRQTVVSPGAFVRVFPVKFLFAQAQYEHNFIRVKYIPPNNGTTTIDRVDANSLLVGAGWSGGRSEFNKDFYYFSVSWDVIRNPNSPYVDGAARSVPIFRAGYNFALFQGRGRNRR